MCGFGGYISSSPIGADKLIKIAKQASFRGPDFTGISLFDKQIKVCFDFGNLAFFHNRLAVMDLTPAANQPFSNERYLLVFNGELYNFADLKVELSSKYTFVSSSDTEVLFYSLIEWGISCISRLNGMFSFAFLDRVTREIILARDRVGIKPLYYHHDKDTFYFSCEVDTITRFMGSIPQINRESVDLYRHFQYIPGPSTIWQGINQLLPGSILKFSIDGGDISISSYWDPYVESAGSDNKNSFDFEKHLSLVVKSQMVSDVDLGVFLSSGVDSSLLASDIMINNNSEKIKFFTVSYSGDELEDESKDAHEFLSEFNCEESSIINLTLDVFMLSEIWCSMYQYYDQPFGDHAALLNMAISKAASEHVSVVISGDGGDEVFCGYDRYRKIFSYNQKYLAWINQLITFFGRIARVNRLILKFEHSSIKRYLIHVSSRMPSLGFLQKVKQTTNIFKNINLVRGRVDIGRLIDFKSYLPDAMLYKVDRSSMAYGLEVRVPFLENSIVKYGLSGNYLDNFNEPKKELRELLYKNAKHYKFKPKVGFNFPLARYMRGGLRNQINSIISGGDFISLHLSKSELMKKYKKLLGGDDRHAYQLWIDLNLIHWHNSKIKQFSEN